MSQSGWDTLQQERVHIAQRAESSLAGSLQAAAQALFEMTTGAGAPGQQRLFLKPHDHARAGGSIIARGSHFSFTATNVSSWEISTNTVFHWVQKDGETKTFVSSQTDPFNFALWVPFGMDTTKTAVSAASVYLEGKVRLYFPTGTSNTSIDCKFYNATTKTYSDTKTASSTGVSLLTFVQIPVKESERNECVLLVKADVAAIAIGILSVNICSTRNTSQVASGGSSDIENTTKP